MSENYCELASLIGHEALFQGKLLKPWPGHRYEGQDDRGLPVAYVFMAKDDYQILRGVCFGGEFMLN